MARNDPVKLTDIQAHYTKLVEVGLAEKFDFGDCTAEEGKIHFNNVMEGIYEDIDELVNGKADREKVYNAAVDTYNQLQDHGLAEEEDDGGEGDGEPDDGGSEDGEDGTPDDEGKGGGDGEPDDEGGEDGDGEPDDAGEPDSEGEPEDPKEPVEPKRTAAKKSSGKKGSTPAKQPAAEPAKPKASGKGKAAAKAAAKPAEEPAKDQEPEAPANVLHIQGFERFGIKSGPMDDKTFAKHENPKFGTDGLYVLTPEQCAEWLEKYNLRNRQLYKSAVKRMGEDAIGENGRAWTFNGGRVAFYEKWNEPKDEHDFPIVIRQRDPDTGEIKGKVKMTKGQLALADGQHRLMMAVTYGVPLVTEVVFGMPWVSENYLDSQQKTRTMKDAIHKDGHKNPGLLSQTAAFLLRYERRSGHNLPTSPWPNISQGQEFIHKNITLEKVVEQVTESVFAMKHAPKFWAAALFLLRKKNAKLAQEVAEKIVEFDGLKKGDPLLLLVKKLTSLEGEKRGGVAAMDEYGALILKAFKAKLDGEKLDKLTFTAKEEYPSF